MSIVTDCDFREQWKWNKNCCSVDVGRDFQKDEQDGKLFDKEMNLGNVVWKLSLMQWDMWI